MNSNRFLSYLSIALIAGLVSANTWAAGDTSIGALVGVASMNQNQGTKFDFGGQVRHTFMPSFAAGVNFTYVNLGSTYSSVTIGGSSVVTDTSANIMHIDADLVYKADEVLAGFWAGARLGVGINKNTFNGQSVSNSAFEYGPAAGYDFMVLPGVSIGADLSYLFASYNGNNVGTFQALGALKYHF